MAKKSQSEHRQATPLELMLGSEGEPSPMPSDLHTQPRNLRTDGRVWFTPHLGLRVEIECYIDGLPYTKQALENRRIRLGLSD